MGNDRIHQSTGTTGYEWVDSEMGWMPGRQTERRHARRQAAEARTEAACKGVGDVEASGGTDRLRQAALAALGVGVGVPGIRPERRRRDDGDRSVVGVHDGSRVQGDRPERREAWVEAVRLALMVAVEAGPSMRSFCPGPWGAAAIGPDPLTLSPAGIGSAIERALWTVGARAPGTWPARRPRARPDTNAPIIRIRTFA